ncbi:MAG: hypothetical protein Q9228_003322 [Teloschistes exilis]
MLLRLFAFAVAVHALPGIEMRNPASTLGGDAVPAVGAMTQRYKGPTQAQSAIAGTVLVVMAVPKTETTVTFSTFSSPSRNLSQADALVCVIEAMQEIYSSSDSKYGISTHLRQTWTYSGSQPKNANCLSMQNQDSKDHILTWGIVVEALRGVSMALSNTTSSACQFDVYNQHWGHLGFGRLGYGQGQTDATLPPATS